MSTTKTRVFINFALRAASPFVRSKRVWQRDCSRRRKTLSSSMHALVCGMIREDAAYVIYINRAPLRVNKLVNKNHKIVCQNVVCIIYLVFAAGNSIFERGARRAPVKLWSRVKIMSIHTLLTFNVERKSKYLW
jgi:hypothetical protein